MQSDSQPGCAKVSIIDYGMGNVGSIANMIKKVGGSIIITSDLSEIENSQKLFYQELDLLILG